MPYYLRFLVFLYLCLLYLWASLPVYAQTQTTPNLINPAGTAWGIPSNQVLNISGISAVEGAGYTTGSAYYNLDTNTIRFGYLPSTVAQTIAINTALQGTGIQINGFNWKYQWMNGGYSSGSLGVAILLSDPAGNTLESQSMSHAKQAEAVWNTEQGTKTFTNPYSLASAGYLSMAISGQDDRFWMGLYGPRVRDPSLSLNYTVDQCSVNPLSSPNCPGYATAYFNQQCTISALYNPSCPGYAQAYFTQQCTANPLYNPACPGYTQAYKTQQCSINTLYATDCPGYQQAYFAQQCQANGLYSTTCPNYAEAYAKKNVLNIGTTTTSSSTSTSAPTTQVKSDGSVSTEVSRTGNSTVDSAISTPSTTSTTGVTSVTSSVSPVNQNSGPNTMQNAGQSAPGGGSQGGGSQGGGSSPGTGSASGPTAQGNNAQTQEVKKTDGEVKSAGSGSTSRDDMKGRVEARAKEVARAGAEAKSFEAQTAVQGTVVALMGFVPGFDAYGNAKIIDVNGLQMARQYNRDNVDNRSVLRRLSGASDRLHNEMVDQQYQK